MTIYLKRRLGICLSRLPSIQTVRLIYKAPVDQSQQFTYPAVGILRKNLERLKEWTGETGRNTLELEVRDMNATVIFPNKEIDEAAQAGNLLAASREMEFFKP